MVASPAIPPPLSRRFSVVHISVFFSLFYKFKIKKVLGLRADLVCDNLIYPHTQASSMEQHTPYKRPEYEQGYSAVLCNR